MLHARRRGLAAVLAASLSLLPNVAVAQMAPSDIPVLPDPVPNQGVQYPASAATAGQAYVGPPKMVLHAECTPFNPCAAASSAPHKLGPLVNSGD